MEPYLTDDKYKKVNLPVTEKLGREIIVFPTGMQICRDNIYKFRDLYDEFMIKNT